MLATPPTTKVRGLGIVTLDELTVTIVLPLATTFITSLLVTVTKLAALDIVEIPVSAAPLPTKLVA